MSHWILRIGVGLFGLMYCLSAGQFILTKQIGFISYAAVTPAEVWTVRNLGVRLLGIGVGMLIVSVANNAAGIALMLTVRIISDMGDLINSVATPGLEPLVAGGLAIFVTAELALLVLAVRLLRNGQSAGMR